jgi:hypothetical protein
MLIDFRNGTKQKDGESTPKGFGGGKKSHCGALDSGFRWLTQNSAATDILRLIDQRNPVGGDVTGHFNSRKQN